MSLLNPFVISVFASEMPSNGIIFVSCSAIYVRFLFLSFYKTARSKRGQQFQKVEAFDPVYSTTPLSETGRLAINFVNFHRGEITFSQNLRKAIDVGENYSIREMIVSYLYSLLSIRNSCLFLPPFRRLFVEKYPPQ